MQRSRATAVRVAVGTLFALILAGPVLLMVLGSLRATDAPRPRSFTLPSWPPALDNYPASMEYASLSRGLVNSIVVAAIFVPLTIVVASWAGLAISRMPAQRRTRWVAVSAIAFLLPITLLMLGRFSVFRTLGISGTYLPLLAPVLLGGSPLFVLLYIWAFMRLPRARFDAAELEGASALQLWGRVAMPMVWPMTAAVAVLAFLLTWNDLLSPLLYLSDPRTFTLPLSLRVLSGVDGNNVPLLLAGAVIATIPVIIAIGGFQAILGRVVRGSER